MYLFIKRIFKSKSIPVITMAAFFAFGLIPVPAYAEWGMVDSLNLAPFIPIVLDALMAVATGGYEFFVGKGTGIIYILIYGFLGISIGLYLIKMWIPKTWLGFLGIKDGGEMWEKDIPTGIQISESVLKPMLRAIVAAVILLQIKPIYVTEWIVNPFLEFGSIYTQSITDSINGGTASAKKIECPPDIVAKGWISANSCTFLVQPVSDLSHENNQIIKRGFDFIQKGLVGLMTLIPHGGRDFLNLITGILLVFTFVSCNLFMALLIIQGIFNFGMSLILYPFNVLVWVAKKPDDPKKWLDLWPAFKNIVTALQQLVITMIACAFILAINIAVVRALFKWNNSVFVVAAGGSAVSNVPTTVNTAMNFGEHSIIWLSALLTFYLMIRIFNLTREQLAKYAGKGSDDLYKSVTGDTKSAWKTVTKIGGNIGKALGGGGKK